MDGFERFAQGHLITLFSATNYCGTANNAGTLPALHVASYGPLCGPGHCQEARCHNISYACILARLFHT